MAATDNNYAADLEDLGEMLWNEWGSKNPAKASTHKAKVLSLTSDDGLTSEVIGVFAVLGGQGYYVDIQTLKNQQPYQFASFIKNTIKSSVPLILPNYIHRELQKRSNDMDDEDSDQELFDHNPELPANQVPMSRPLNPEPQVATGLINRAKKRTLETPPAIHLGTGGQVPPSFPGKNNRIEDMLVPPVKKPRAPRKRTVTTTPTRQVDTSVIDEVAEGSLPVDLLSQAVHESGLELTDNVSPLAV